MKVSVIIRTYNRGYILSEAIESALTQTHRNIEILVVDDGSTDETMEVMKRFQDKRVRYLRHDRNRGVGAACNTGIAAATGDAVAFLDTDDLWKPEMLERLVSYLFSHPELGAVFCDVEIMNARGVTPSTTRLMHSFPKLLRRVQGDGEYLLSPRGMYVCLLEEVPIKMIAVLLRRLVFDKVGAFNEGGRSGEDWEFFIRLSRCTSFGYIDAPLAIQRVSADATHTKYREEDKTFLLDFCRREKGRLGDDMEALQAIKRGMNHHTRSLGGLYLHGGNRRKSISTYLRGFRDTGNPEMLLRAASAYVPLNIRNLLVRAITGADAS